MRGLLLLKSRRWLLLLLWCFGVEGGLEIHVARGHWEEALRVTSLGRLRLLLRAASGGIRLGKRCCGHPRRHHWHRFHLCRGRARACHELQFVGIGRQCHGVVAHLCHLLGCRPDHVHQVGVEQRSHHCPHEDESLREAADEGGAKPLHFVLDDAVANLPRQEKPSGHGDPKRETDDHVPEKGPEQVVDMVEHANTSSDDDRNASQGPGCANHLDLRGNLETHQRQRLSR
mmetsp:Transcript_23461/g.44187  ORF Transcript_23461/g.44187 Transcript_23461/m.44187 type:complete len:230 (-) Transcript_23461:203-892(-)